MRNFIIKLALISCIVCNAQEDYLLASLQQESASDAVYTYSVVERINFGAAGFTATDGGPNWKGLTGTAPITNGNLYLIGSQDYSTVSRTWTRHSSIPASMPDADFQTIFDSERWDDTPAPEMKLTVSDLANGIYKVRLYVGESQPQAELIRIYNVLFQNIERVTGFNTKVHFGGPNVAGTIEVDNIEVTSNVLTIEWIHSVQNPQVNGIEILKRDTSYSFSAYPTWGDEFDYSGSPNASKWGYDIGTGHGGWGNNELQYATSRTDNVVVADGKLKIIAKQESYNGMNYTSARLNTRSVKQFQYGRFIFRAKLPNTAGMWPAIWMFGHNYKEYFLDSWPSSGELDIVEVAGSRPTIAQQSVHTADYYYGNNFQTYEHIMSNISTEFNDYRIDWTPDYIRWFVNDVQTFEFLNDGTGHDGWPFDDYLHLLIALNVGGDFVGGTVNNSALPATMEVEYVRYYKLLGGHNTSLPAALDAAPTITPTSTTINSSGTAVFSVVGKPAGKTVNWYGLGFLYTSGDTLYVPGNMAPAGTYTFHAVLVDDVTGEHSEPRELTLTITP